jgi:putative transcriptional regulator
MAQGHPFLISTLYVTSYMMHYTILCRTGALALGYGRQMTAATPTKTPIDFTALVREIRQALHITQEQLARELQVTFGTVNGWENGKHRPIPALARSLVELAVASKIPQRRYISRGTITGTRARRKA